MAGHRPDLPPDDVPLSTAPAPPVPRTGDDVTFWNLVVTMFQASFSDNLYKILLTVMALDVAHRVSDTPKAGDQLGAAYQSYITVSYALPWIFGVGIAGWLSDRFSKTRVTRWTKMMEILLMLLACVAIGTQHIWLGILVVFLISLESALFSPSKYGILPELLPDRRLGWANGVLQGFTFISILMGTLAGPMVYGFLSVHHPDRLWLGGVLLVALAGVGLLFAYMMRETPPANPQEPLKLNPITMATIYGREILASPGLTWGVAGMAMWWVAAIMTQNAAVVLCRNILRLSDQQLGVALMPMVVGMGAGCFLASRLSRDRIELGLVPVGAFGAFATSVVLWLNTPRAEALTRLSAEGREDLIILLPVLMGVIGLFSALVMVSLEAYVVHASDPKVRGGIWATSNLIIALGWIVGAGLYPLAYSIHGNPADVFLAGGILLLVMAVVVCWRFPRIPLRLMVLVFFRGFYRVRALGLENIPAKGGALLAPNHQSYLDGILIASIVDRPVRFVMSKEIYHKPIVYPFAKLTNSIPIEQNQSPRELITALREARAEIEAGGLVCLFPEGQLSRIGQMLPFRRGMERIMKDLDAPIIPLAIDGAYDTAFALPAGRMNLRQLLHPRRRNINVAVGKPLPAHTEISVVRRQVVELMVDAFAERKAEAEPLHRMAISRLRRRFLEKDFSDHSTNGLVPNMRVVAGVAILGKLLKPIWKQDEFIGILLPPCIASVTLNITALTAGHVPVNLNYTASPAIVDEICNTAGVRVIITSKAFVEKAKLTVPAGRTIVYLEDLAARITKLDRWLGAVQGLAMPVTLLERWLGRRQAATPDDLCTLIFSSGSTGVPKGVMLTHWNLLSNVIATIQVVNLNEPAPRVLGILPFFHSFGFMSTLWLPIYKGMGASYYPNPLDGRSVGEVVERFRVTHMFATPTFLSGYVRRVDPGQFGSLTFVLTGAEKLREGVATSFRQRFGIPVGEGFGCTECSPVVSLNGSDFRAPGFFQKGGRFGTVGHPIPGVSMRVVDLETGEDVGTGQPGLLMVRGANVMKGYYRMPEKTAEALRDGWYQTGDMASIDEDGLVTITDRLARFSKIGGEMVPHIRIEETLQRISGFAEQVFAVTAVPDEAKGERLAVLYTIPEADAKATAQALGKGDHGLPSLWLPKWPDFVKVDQIPCLGTGKMDLRAMKAMAVEALAKKKPENTPSEPA